MKTTDSMKCLASSERQRPARRPAAATMAGPAAALTSGLLCPAVLGAPGDVDPGFASRSQVPPLPDLTGPVWSLQPHGDDGFVFAGGDYSDYCSYWDYECGFFGTGFAGRVRNDGSLDPAYAAARLDDVEVLDVAVLQDGSAIGVGRHASGVNREVAVFRLRPGGGLDAGFGDDGIVLVSSAEDGSAQGSSLVVDPDGRIVVAGTLTSALIVARLLPDGSLDAGFGESGTFALRPPVETMSATRPLIRRTADGTYRIALSSNPDLTPNGECLLIGVTSSGTLDRGFGEDGIVRVRSGPPAAANCVDLAIQPDGRLIVAGTEGPRAFAERLLPTGERDAGFAASAVQATMADATSVALGNDGTVLVAGHDASGISGALIVRLQADGLLDAVFGSAGRAWFDLPGDLGTDPVVRDMVATADGGVVLAGGSTQELLTRPFLARLLGSEARGSPGMLGFERDRIDAPAGHGQAVVVRRTGGKTGAVSVGLVHGTVCGTNRPPNNGCGTAQVRHTLTWADGEDGDREVVIGAPGGSSLLVLTDPQGGATVGNPVSIVDVAGDTAVAGAISLDATSISVTEGPPAFAELTLRRDYVATGDVSVTVTPTAGSASADSDFLSRPIQISWRDGDRWPRTVRINIVDDAEHEAGESFTIVLSNPTGGALLLGPTTATVAIADDDPPPQSGGGVLGMWSALLLGLASLLRRTLRRRDRTAADQTLRVQP